MKKKMKQREKERLTEGIIVTTIVFALLLFLIVGITYSMDVKRNPEKEVYCMEKQQGEWKKDIWYGKSCLINGTSYAINYDWNASNYINKSIYYIEIKEGLLKSKRSY